MTLGDAILGVLRSGPGTIPQLARAVSKGSGREIHECQIFGAVFRLESARRVKYLGSKPDSDGWPVSSWGRL